MEETYIIKNILRFYFPFENSKRFIMYMYRGTLLFLPKTVSSHVTSIESEHIVVAICNKKAIGSSMESTCFLICGLGIRRGSYKIKKICIKLNIIHKYKLIITN